MLRWAAIFLIVAIFAGVLGFGGLAGPVADAARFLFFIFIVISVILGAMAVCAGRKVL